MSCGVINIETKRLYISNLRYSDWPDLLEIFNDFEQSPYRNYDSPMPISQNDVEVLVKVWVKSGNYFVVKLRDRSEIIGYICYHNEDKPDIGFAFKSKYQGRGYAFEALNTWIKNIGFHQFTAGTAVANIPAVRLLEKLGFKLIGTEELSFREGIKFIGNVYELNL